MISTPTVLILGAGASKPYDFPTGRELLLEIVHGLDDLDAPLAQVLQGMEFSPGLLSLFRDDLWASAQPSVDAFLEHRRDFADIGKAAIAYSLVRRERADVLRPGDQERWYEYLFGRLTTQFDAFASNNLSIISFNYDRSLEHFLITALKASYQLGDAAAFEALRTIDVIHVHGQLGWLTLKHMPGAGRPYESDLELAQLKTAIAGIEVIHEGSAQEHSRSFSMANAILNAAHVICFLGFGYLETNLDRLGIRSIVGIDDPETPPYIFGTAKDLGRAEAERVSRYMYGNIELGTDAEGALTFLQNYPVLNRD